jgi:hypothetical protein
VSKSVLKRIDKDFANYIASKQRDFSGAVNRPITFVQATKILNTERKKDNSSSSVVFYNKRGKRVLL